MMIDVSGNENWYHGQGRCWNRGMISNIYWFFRSLLIAHHRDIQPKKDQLKLE